MAHMPVGVAATSTLPSEHGATAAKMRISLPPRRNAFAFIPSARDERS